MPDGSVPELQCVLFGIRFGVNHKFFISYSTRIGTDCDSSRIRIQTGNGFKVAGFKTHHSEAGKGGPFNRA